MSGKSITVAFGDGIGPEIMDAVLYILKEAEVNLKIDTIEVGEKLYKRNYSAGIAEDTWQTIARNKILLKAPITTPQGGGYKSLNVTLRKALGLYANVRPTISYYPFIDTKHTQLDLAVIRENEEDLYTGIEYQQTHNMCQSLKLISRTGCEKIIRYAFDYALQNNRKKVTCFSKDNIMKMTDGLFHKVFKEIAIEYPDINSDHYIIDIGTARLANKPEIFDVIVTSNLYGDIISDVASEISGSVGLAGSANIGNEYAMFEAVHGSAPDIAGQNIANPSGLLNAAIMMLVHIGEGSKASLIENAWKRTLEDGEHTVDIYNAAHSNNKLGTKEFAQAVAARLGKVPSKLTVASYPDQSSGAKNDYKFEINTQAQKDLVGCDVYFDCNIDKASDLADKIQECSLGKLKLHTISSKGLKLWPDQHEGNFNSDHWCCRFFSNQEKPAVINPEEIAALLDVFAKKGLNFIKIENLYNFDGQRGYSLAQGE